MFRSVVFICLMLPYSLLAQVKPVQFSQIAALQQKEEKLVMVFIYTDWCKYCKAMRHAMMNNKKLSDLLNRRFYTVFFDAESTENIVFAEQIFKYKPTGLNIGVHQLAEQLGAIDGQLSFPTLCFLNKKNEIVYQYSGFIDSQSLLKLLSIVSTAKPTT
jgi:thioredoxin-related protein